MNISENHEEYCNFTRLFSSPNVKKRISKYIYNKEKPHLTQEQHVKFMNVFNGDNIINIKNKEQDIIYKYINEFNGDLDLFFKDLHYNIINELLNNHYHDDIEDLKTNKVYIPQELENKTIEISKNNIYKIKHNLLTYKKTHNILNTEHKYLYKNCHSYNEYQTENLKHPNYLELFKNYPLYKTDFIKKEYTHNYIYNIDNIYNIDKNHVNNTNIQTYVFNLNTKINNKKELHFSHDNLYGIKHNNQHKSKVLYYDSDFHNRYYKAIYLSRIINNNIFAINNNIYHKLGKDFNKHLLYYYKEKYLFDMYSNILCLCSNNKQSICYYYYFYIYVTKHNINMETIIKFLDIDISYIECFFDNLELLDKIPYKYIQLYKEKYIFTYSNSLQ